MVAFLQWLWSPIWLLFFDHLRATRALLLLRLLQAAVERGASPVPFLEVLADEAGFVWRGRLQRLAGLLAGGASLREAFESVPGLLPRDVLLTLRVGFALGHPKLALDGAIAQLSRRVEPTRRLGGAAILYLVFAAMVMSAILGFVSVWIIPKFRAIFSSFGLDLPPATRFMIDHAGQLAASVMAIAAPLTLVALLAAGMISEVSARGMFWSPSTWLSRLWPRVRAPGVLRCLEVGIRAGLPLERAMNAIVELAVGDVLRQHLALACHAMTQGEDGFQALRQARVLSRSDVALLHSARRAGNLGWALGALSDLLQRRAAYRFQVLHEWARPLLYLPLGLPVAFIVVAMFLPLIELIKQLS